MQRLSGAFDVLVMRESYSMIPFISSLRIGKTTIPRFLFMVTEIRRVSVCLAVRRDRRDGEKRRELSGVKGKALYLDLGGGQSYTLKICTFYCM